MVSCPICNKSVKEKDINSHLDSGCESFIDTGPSPPAQKAAGSQRNPVSVSRYFQTPTAKRTATVVTPKADIKTALVGTPTHSDASRHISALTQRKRSLEDEKEFSAQEAEVVDSQMGGMSEALQSSTEAGPIKKPKLTALQKAAPLAERMRPRTLDDIYGQELVGPHGVLRGLIEQDRVPSMILWGGAGTGKTTIARCIASLVGSRFVEINSANTGVAECKKIFADARGELTLAGRKTIVFCDEIHRFSKSQQDVFLGPVETGLITLIGATTENPSFKVQNSLLSRCRTFTLQKLTGEDIRKILERALVTEKADSEEQASLTAENDSPPLVDDELLTYLATFSDGDARTALNLLELALSLSTRPGMTKTEIKSSLTQTLVYDRAGDQHYDTISAFHKSVRGSAPDAALYYLARMLQSGEDPLYIARRMVVIASEDVGLADNTLLPLATAAYAAAEKLGMPECRIALAHCTVALCLAPKSTRAYRALNSAVAALREPGVAALPIPVHLRNAPTRLMKELGFGAEYKYNPNYKDGRVVQEYLPDGLLGRHFLEDRDLGTEVDPEAWA
jgi:putative ATPase